MKYYLCLVLCFTSFLPAKTQEYPLLKTSWKQSQPYDSCCPVNIMGHKTLPGCGAVALAQIVNYHQKWNHAFGHYSYISTYSYKDMCKVDVDFDSKKFDFPNMLNDYYTNNNGNNYNETQAYAVSDFIFQIGAAIRMQFRTANQEGSVPANKGTTLWGIHHFLHYSPKARIRKRIDYSSSEWIEMLNRELDANCPVYYGGNTYRSSKPTGHIFVIDGYDGKDTYHVNWGTTNPPRGGVNLNILNQMQLENPIPGSGDVCYNADQYMITDLRPAMDNEVFTDSSLLITEPIIFSDAPDEQNIVIDKNGSFYIDFFVENYSIITSRYNFRFGLYDSKNRLKDYIGNWSYTFGPGSYVERFKLQNQKMTLPQSLPDGNYKLRLLCQLTSETELHPVMESLSTTIELHVKGDKTTVVLSENHRRSTGIYLIKEISKSENRSIYNKDKNRTGTVINLSIKNPSTNNFCDTLRLALNIEGQVPQYFKTIIAVYDGCVQDCGILIPEETINLKNKNFSVHVDYWNKSTQEYLPLVYHDPASVSTPDYVQKAESLHVFDSKGHLVQIIKAQNISTIYASLLHKLPKGLYIIKEGNKIRKIIK